MHQARAVGQTRVAFGEGCERRRVIELRRREVRDRSAHDLDDPNLLRARNESCAQLVGHVGGAVNEVIVLGEDVD
eukprot:6009244-Prymnesium_polylepis.1